MEQLTIIMAHIHMQRWISFVVHPMRRLETLETLETENARSPRNNRNIGLTGLTRNREGIVRAQHIGL